MIERRNFLKLAGSTAALALAMARRAFAADGSKSAGPPSGEIPRRGLGHTGEQVSIVGIGGHHLGRALVEESESIRIVRTALDSGVNFLDNSWDYNDGISEMRVGKALRDGYRDKAFVMTKIDGRDKTSATRQIEDSLRRLQTDRIDLVQFHEVIRMNDPDRIFANGGAIEAMLDAKQSGKLRFIGFTATKVLKFTFTCWKPRTSTASHSTPCRCRLT